jgi:wyosine [tRNA(Phe)-imidazoG37] synthetase (radical SAM superfamily)
MDSPTAPRVFGPVPSRRLGRSLGINNIPGKQCSYSCGYCQAGRTTCLRESREAFYPPAVIRADVEEALNAVRAKRIDVDYITFVPTGEPTLDTGLGRAIELIKPLGVPVAVFSNASLLWRGDVRDELMLADWVSVKIDAADEVTWRRINRPHGHLLFARLLRGVRAFSRHFGGTLVTETMLVAGLNDAPDAVDAVAWEIAALQPAEAWLGVPVRPPAERWVRAPSAERFDRALEIFLRHTPDVHPLLHYDEAPWRVLDAEGQQLLAMSAVHPLRESELDEILRASGCTREAVDALLREGRLEIVTYEGLRFYRAVAGLREVPEEVGT